ncbi:uncharacterized protein [Triticum aestivum]|uniref:uncharacterized protein isoform X2 n=1 Tax=Triticum aestivum TaxID=4565 RepID=UPI001D02DE40|nr:uncharacterized protein LOC123060476 isoform X2 [Triticum aestivum]XP_044412208.1 uncharacterized protein LOC123136775 isoform X2 [Triticum aestivum]
MLDKILQILSTQPPSLQEDFNEWSPRSFPKSYKRLRLDEPLTKTHLYSEFLHAKMDHQLRNMLANLSQVANNFFLIVILVWSRPRKSQFKSSRRGVWRLPAPVAALLVFIACFGQIQSDLSYGFSTASLCFMCIWAEKMTRPAWSLNTASLPLLFASHTLPYANVHHHRILADRRCAFWRKLRQRFLFTKKIEPPSASTDE